MLIILAARFILNFCLILAHDLTKLGWKTHIVFIENNSTYLDDMYNNHNPDDIFLIYCFQYIPELILKHLKKRYIFFNLEQNCNERLSLAYREISDSAFQSFLENALVVLDYSHENAAIFYRHFGIRPQVVSLPIAADVCTHPIKKNQIVFIGRVKGRRINILQAIQKRFPLQIYTNELLDNLHQILRTTKLLINLHGFNNAILERVRLNEAITCGTLILSEYPSFRDMDATHDYINIVRFINVIENENYTELFQAIEDMWYQKLDMAVFQKAVSHLRSSYLKDIRSVFNITNASIDRR